MYGRAANAYRKVDLESAPPTQIVERLFARFLDDTAQARGAIARRDVAAKGAAIDHALRIVGELEASLDHRAAPELCANLAALYQFAADRLISANLTLNPGDLDAADRIMRDLGAAFAEAHRVGAGAAK